MGITDRKLRQKEEVRASILDTAWDLVVTEGWHSFSIRKIADAIEYSVPVIYSHFENKDAILLEFNRKGFQLLTETLADAKSGQTNPADQIRAMGRAYWNFAFANKEYYQLMFGIEVNCCIMDELLPAGSTPYDIAAEPIAKLMGISDIEDDRVCTKYYTYWSIIHGLVSINIVRKGTSDEINQQILRDAITGITRSLKN